MSAGTIGGLELHPGFEYTVEAFVCVEPLIQESSKMVYGWQSKVVSKSEYRKELGADEDSHLARVRLTVGFDPTATSSILSRTYPLIDAAVDVGASVLYCSLALLLLRRIRRALSHGVYLPSRGYDVPQRVSALTARAHELKAS